MYTYTWYQWLAFFYLYCFLGWIFESTYVSLKEKHFVNRGFLRLPMLPLYGFGAVMMLWVSIPVQDNLILVYLSGFIAATALEYVTGAVMERLFKVRYWDYSNQHFQLHGYICLSSSIAWGFLTIFMTDVIHEPISGAVLAISPVVLISCDFIITLLFTLDTYESTKAALALGQALEAITKLKSDIEILQEKIEQLSEEAIERGILTREEAKEKLSAAQAKAVCKLTSIKHDTVNHMNIRAKAANTAKLLHAAAINNTNRLHSVKQNMSEQLTEIRNRADARLAFDSRLAGMNSQLAILKERLKSTHPAKKLHIFYRRELLRGNPTAVSSRFAAALNEIKEQFK